MIQNQAQFATVGCIRQYNRYQQLQQLRTAHRKLQLTVQGIQRRRRGALRTDLQICRCVHHSNLQQWNAQQQHHWCQARTSFQKLVAVLFFDQENCGMKCWLQDTGYGLLGSTKFVQVICSTIVKSILVLFIIAPFTTIESCRSCRCWHYLHIELEEKTIR